MSIITTYNWIYLYIVFIFLGIFNTQMLKWAYNKGLSINEQMACSRFFPLFLDLYLVIRFLRPPLTLPKIVSILSGLLVIASFPLSYSFLKINDVSKLQPYTGLTMAITALFAWIVLHEGMTWRRGLAIGIVGIAMYLLKEAK
jgi:drug/metabolite transporter (DMT)-like permease